MSLEEELQRNTAAIEKLIAVLETKAATGSSEKAKPATKPAAEEVTLSDLRTVMAKLGREDGLKLLAKYDVSKLPDLPEEAYAEVHAIATGMLGERS